MKEERKIDKKTLILIGLGLAVVLFIIISPLLSIGIFIGGILYFIYTKNPKLQKQIKELLKRGEQNVKPKTRKESKNIKKKRKKL